jgi:transcriptional antiterminator NusG
MRQADWYVIQVQAGREAKACDVVRRAWQNATKDDADNNVLQECFSPTYEFRRKEHGEWVQKESLLLPGYVIAVTTDPWSLARALWSTPEFTKLLTMGKTFVPLSKDDKSWIERWTQQGDRSIPISFAYKKGDTIVVTEGPLVGLGGMITRVNRRRRVAHVEIHAGQVTIHTTVGLEVMPAPEAQSAAEGCKNP